MSEYTSIDQAYSHDRQPSMSFIEVYVADKILRSKINNVQSKAPEYVQSLEFTRITENTGNVSMVFYDPEFDQLESTFILGWQHIKFRYGFVDGVQSDLSSCILTNYSVQYHSKGATIAVQGIAAPNSDNTKMVTANLNTANPTEAVKRICGIMGWGISKEMDATENVNLGNSEYFTMNNVHPVDYINTYIVPVSKRVSDGSTGFTFYLDSDNKAHFLVVSKGVGNIVRRYFYGKGINSSVVDINLNVKGLFGGAGNSSSATNISINSIDPITSEVSETVVTTSQVDPDQDDPDSTTTDTPDTQQDTVSSGGMSSDMVINRVSYALNSGATDAIPYQGTITVLGDPKIVIGNKIQLILVGSDIDHKLNASGVYIVKSVADSVSSGKYLTSLEIIRQTADSGNTSATGTDSSTTESTGGDGDQTSGDSADYSINKKIDKARVRILVTSSGTGHFELQIPGEVVFKNKTFKNPVFSYGSNSKLIVCPLSKDDARYSGKSYTPYYFEFDVSGDKFYDFIKYLEKYVTSTSNGSNYSSYGLKGPFSSYNINKYNCFTAVATWVDYLGYDTLLNIAKNASSYKEYTAPAMYKKYGKNWKKY